MESNGLAIGPISQHTGQGQCGVGSVDRKERFWIRALFSADCVQCAIGSESQTRNRLTQRSNVAGRSGNWIYRNQPPACWGTQVV